MDEKKYLGQLKSGEISFYRLNNLINETFILIKLNMKLLIFSSIPRCLIYLRLITF